LSETREHQARSCGAGSGPKLCYRKRRINGRAGVAELVDALDLGSSDESRGGSSPSARTISSFERPDPSSFALHQHRGVEENLSFISVPTTAMREGDGEGNEGFVFDPCRVSDGQPRYGGAIVCRELVRSQTGAEAELQLGLRRVSLQRATEDAEVFLAANMRLWAGASAPLEKARTTRPDRNRLHCP
jgi:hypothetical protein